MANPWVRVGLAVYLAGALGLVLLLSGSDGGTHSFQSARASYESSYLPDLVHLREERRHHRLITVDRLYLELEAQWRSEQWSAARDTCRRLMEVDGDPGSPIYRFAALCLADLTRKTRNL